MPSQLDFSRNIGGSTKGGNVSQSSGGGFIPVRVKKVNSPTPEYFDNNGSPKPQFTGSLPTTSSGVFGTAIGSNVSTDEGKYYENISNTNIQGLQASDYTISLSLLYFINNIPLYCQQFPPIIDLLF